MFQRLAIFSLSMITSAAFAETEVAQEEIPSAAFDTATRTAPGVEFDRVEIDDENGAPVYEFQATGPAGRRIEIDVRADGSLEEIEMEGSEAELQTAVRQSILKAYPGFAFDYVETSVRADGLFVYEIEGRTADGRAISLDVGDIVNIEGTASS
ncbi:MAG: PepSY domain-containing protein [Pseudomonadota bacterium]